MDRKSPVRLTFTVVERDGSFCGAEARGYGSVQDAITGLVIYKEFLRQGEAIGHYEIKERRNGKYETVEEGGA